MKRGVADPETRDDCTVRAVRTIGHVDLDAIHGSVEQWDCVELQGESLTVGVSLQGESLTVGVSRWCGPIPRSLASPLPLRS